MPNFQYRQKCCRKVGVCLLRSRCPLVFLWDLKGFPREPSPGRAPGRAGLDTCCRKGPAGWWHAETFILVFLHRNRGLCFRLSIGNGGWLVVTQASQELSWFLCFSKLNGWLLIIPKPDLAISGQELVWIPTKAVRPLRLGGL